MAYKIPFISLATEAKRSRVDTILGEIRQLFERSDFILGRKVEEFEKAFAAYCGTGHAVGVNSGLDALILSLRALGIGSGDEVITAPNSYLATAAAITLVGAKPVFADVKPDFNLHPKEVEKKISPRTKAVIAVHLTGLPCDMESLSKICKQHGIFLMEDAAQAVGASYHGRKVGNLSDVGCFSLHPLKNLPVWGDGGIVTTNDLGLATRLRQQRNHGLVTRDVAEFFSFNSRLDSLQAIVGLEFLPQADSVAKRRQANADIYFKRLENRVGLPTRVSGSVVPVYHVFQIQSPRRDELRAYLDEKGIETKIHYPVPIHLQPAARELGYKAGDFPECEKQAREILSLPIREELSEAEIHEVCDAVEAFFDQSTTVSGTSKHSAARINGLEHFIA